MKKNQSELNLIEKADAGEKNYLEAPATELLDAFGKGNHIPGSGSASALSGLIGVELMKTVCKLSIDRKGYEDHQKEFVYILKTLDDEFSQKFRSLFNFDIKIFHEVSYHRRQRDLCEINSKSYEIHRNQAVEKLRDATDIPIDICETSLQLINNAIFLFDNGFGSAKGDSGVAISNLLSAAQGALFVVFLNLKTFQKSKWKDEKMDKAVSLALRFTQVQKEAYRRVISLYNDNSNSNQLTMDFYKE